MKEATEEALASYYQTKDQLVKSYEEKLEEFSKVKDGLKTSFEEKKEEIKEKKPATKDECKMIKSSRKRSSITGKGVTKTPFGKK